MKALTLTQPWASLVAVGAKRIETRSWSTRYRGPLVIHAAKGLGSVGGARGLLDTVKQEPFHEALRPLYENTPGELSLPLGCIVAIARLVDVVRTETLTALPFWQGFSDDERAFGDYTPGRYGWVLESVEPFPEPVPCKGALGLWEVPYPQASAVVDLALHTWGGVPS